MSFRMATLASGSEGNAVFAEYGSTRILIDAGISFRQICEQLRLLGVEPESLSALLLTHEHSDHIQGLAAVMRRLRLPVYTSPGTFEALSALKVFERMPKECFHLIRPGEAFPVGELTVTGLRILHDCREPLAFRADADGVHFAVVTDLGSYDDSLADALQGLNVLLLEANHNRQMLETGPYPYPLKIRIDGEKGHLSNEASAQLLSKLVHPGLETVLLGHISRTNNYPLLALETVRSAMNGSGFAPGRPRILTAPPHGLSDIITINDTKP